MGLESDATGLTGTYNTVADLTEFLACNGTVDLKLFGKDGWGSVDDLSDDLHTNNVRLAVSPHTQRVYTLRLRSKGRLECGSYTAYEVRRKYPKNTRYLGIFQRWRTIEKPESHAISETQQIGNEDPLTALNRGFLEEWGIDIPQHAIEPDPPMTISASFSPEQPSRVYPTIWSISRDDWFTIRLPKRPCRWNPVIHDQGVLIYLQWVYWGGDEPFYQRMERKMLSFIIRILFTIRYAL